MSRASPNPSNIVPCLNPSKPGCPGHNPRKCPKHKTGTSEPCGRYPVKGATVCPAHGGKAPQVKAAAERRVVEENLRKAVGRLVAEPVLHPMKELQLLAGKAKAWMEVCEQHIAELERLRYSTEGGEQIRGEVVLFERAVEACRKVLVDQIRLGIDARLTELSKEDGRAMAATIAAIVRALGFDPADPKVQAIAQTAISQHTGVGPAVIEGSVA